MQATWRPGLHMIEIKVWVCTQSFIINHAIALDIKAAKTSDTALSNILLSKLMKNPKKWTLYFIVAMHEVNQRGTTCARLKEFGTSETVSPMDPVVVVMVGITGNYDFYYICSFDDVYTFYV